MEICFSDKDTFIKGRYNVLSDKKPMTAQLSHKICNILPVMHILIGCNYIDLFYGKSKIHTFKKMFLKPELTALIQFLKTPNLNFFNKLLILFFLFYITDQSPRWLSLCNSICKKRKKIKGKRFTNSLLTDQHSLNMKILRTSFKSTCLWLVIN